MDPDGGKGDQGQADDPKQKLSGGMPESMGRGFRQVRPSRRRMPIDNPTHPSIPVSLWSWCRLSTTVFPHAGEIA